MRVLVEEVRRSPVVAIQAWVHVGSGDETPEQAGLSHMLEHMLFKGGGDLGIGDIAREIEGCGGEINAFTSFDHTVLHMVVPSRYFDRGLAVAHDAVTTPHLDPEEFEREKAVVLEEIRRGEDEPSAKLSKAVFAELFREHPYGRPVIGSVESVLGLQLAQMRAFHERWYARSNITMVVVGDVDADAAHDAVAARFAHHPRLDTPVRIRAVEPPQRSVRARVLSERVHEVRAEMAFPLPAVDHPDIPTADVLAVILGQGESSRLNQALRIERRLVNHVQTYAYTPRDPGVFIVALGCTPERLDDGLGAAGEVIGRFVQEGPTADEVRRAVVNILSERTYERETVEGVARKFGYFDALFGDPEAEARYYAGIAEMTPAALQRFAGETLRPRRATLAVLSPPDHPREPADVADRFCAGLREPRGIAERPTGPSTTRHTLPNGVQLVLRETPGSGLVSIRLGAQGGLRSETRRNNGVHNLLARVWTRGTQRRDARRFSEAMEEIAGRCAAFSGRNSFGLSSTFLANGMERGVDLLAEALLEPQFPADETERLRDLTLEAIRTLPDNPVSFGFLRFHELMYRKHPFRMPTMGTEVSVKRLTPGRLRAAYRRGLVGSNVVVAAVGDFDADTLAGRLSDAFAEIPEGPRPVPDIAPEAPMDRTRARRIPVDKEQAHLMIGVPGASVTDPRRHALEMLAAILAGQSGRLFIDLRDRQGLAYSVTAWSQEAVDPGYFAIYIGTELSKVPQAREGILGHLQRLCDEPVPADELERAARYLVGSYEIGLQRGGSVANRILFDELYGIGPDMMEAYPERILALTPGDLQAAAREFFTVGRHVDLTLVPQG